MNDLWVKLASAQFDFALNLTRAFLGICDKETLSCSRSSAEAPGAPEPTEAKTIDENPQQADLTEPPAEVAPVAPPVAAVTAITAVTAVPAVPNSDAVQGVAQISGGAVAEAAPRSAGKRVAGARGKTTAISRIMTFLDSASEGATLPELAERLEMDRKTIHPILKALVKEKRLDELLGRYCILKH